MKRWVRRIYIGGLILAPIVLLILPANFFDTGPPMCVSQIFFHRSCPGCGMTRACMHLIHFDFARAYFFNKLVFVVFPLLALLYATEIFRVAKKFLVTRGK